MRREIRRLGHIALLYSIADDGNVSLSAVPCGTESRVDWRAVENAAVPGRAPEPMVQVAVLGDEYPRSFQNGLTLRNASGRSLKFVSQSADENAVVTVLEGGGRRAEHFAERVTDDVVRFHVALTNTGSAPFTVERLDSFSLSGVGPFSCEFREGELTLVRVRSRWSLEGVVERIDPYDIDFQCSWSYYHGKAEKWGGIGSMPDLSYMPLSGVELPKENVAYAVLTETDGSWQTEFFRESEPVGWGSGRADFYFGQWQKTLAPGERLETCAAYFTCCEGRFDDCCRRLVRMQATEFPVRLPAERSLPVVFNEFCATWGSPEERRVLELARAAAEAGAEYFVIDAGWYKTEGKWENIGDWRPSPALFPDGMKALADRIRALGLRPGIWFEWEGASTDSDAWRDHADAMLTRQGQRIRCGDRGFWDLRTETGRTFFREWVLGRLKEWGMGYLKTDYNENIGIGCDGAESLGEGLRQQMLAVKQCFAELRVLPDFVLEICSSGGMRIEPGFMRIADQFSCSDTHECDEGGIVAADMQRLLHPAKSQIWAVIRADDTPERMAHTLSKAFLGRMCLSGDLDRLDEERFALVKRAVDFYRRAVPVILNGDSYLFREGLRDYRRLDGVFASVRAGDGGDTLVVIGAYNRPEYRVSHPALKGRIAETFGCGRERFALDGDTLTVGNLAACGGVAVRIARA